MEDKIRQQGASEVVLSLITKLKTAPPEKKPIICSQFLDRYPEMIILQNVGRMLLHQLDSANLTTQYLDTLENELKTAIKKTVQHLPKTFPKNAIIMTLSKSSTVLTVIEHFANRIKEVVVLESRPGLEGRAMSKEIAKTDTPVTIIADAAAGLFMENIDLAMIGADAILPRGYIVNKIGSLPFALLCQRYDKPFYVVSSLLKTDIHSIGVKLKKRPQQEIWENSPEGITPKNIYFERVPYTLLTGVWCEQGILPPPTVAQEAQTYISTLS